MAFNGGHNAKNKYMLNSSEGATPDTFDPIDNSINLEFASIESDEQETYCSDESVSKKPDALEMYRSLQDDFVAMERDSNFSSTHEKYSTPTQSFEKSSVAISSIRIYDASPPETAEMTDIFKDDDFDRPALKSLAFPVALRMEAGQEKLTSSDEIGRLESVLKRWQATVVDENDADNIGSPSLIVSQGEFMRNSPSLRISEPIYPTFSEITFQEAIEACLTVSIQPSHYSASAVLRHTTASPLTCCISAPANDSRAATDRALVFAVADWRYSENLPLHWQTLATIYSKYTGELNTIYRYGSHWEKIGFQGSDPVTDLRSAGYLGLLHLLFLATQATALAQQCYTLSIQPRSQFPLAITGLNLTKMVMGAIRSGRLKVEKNRAASVIPGRHAAASDRFLVASCKLYVSLWQSFATTWAAKHCTIENSHEVLQKLEKLANRQANALLKKSTCYLNGSYLLQQRGAMFATTTNYTANSNHGMSPRSVASPPLETHSRNAAKNNSNKGNAATENITYTDISSL